MLLVQLKRTKEYVTIYTLGVNLAKWEKGYLNDFGSRRQLLVPNSNCRKLKKSP